MGDPRTSRPPPPPFNLKRALVIIAAWPDGQCFPEIPMRLGEWGIPPDHITKHWEWSPIDTAYNLAVQQIALPSSHDWFVFFDKDIKPGIATWPFFEAAIEGRADVIGCLYDVIDNATWGEPTRIHTGLHCVPRGVYEALGWPWYQTVRTSGGNVANCCCEFFRRRVVQAGFTIARAGWAEHTPKYGPHAKEKPCGRRTS